MVASRVAALWLAVLLVGLTTATAWAKPGKEAEPPLPPAPARLWIVAPSAQGQWLLRIDNEGDEPLRIAADVRLLRLEVWPQSKGKWARRPETCDGPKSFGLSDSFPAGRELLLEPGQSWVEPFDPRLICFGKQAKLLEGGVLVRPHFGWPEAPRWSRTKARDVVAVDATQVPRRYEARRELVAPTMLLSFMAPEPWARTIDQLPFPPPAGKKGHHGKGGSDGNGNEQQERASSGDASPAPTAPGRSPDAPPRAGSAGSGSGAGSASGAGSGSGAGPHGTTAEPDGAGGAGSDGAPDEADKPAGGGPDAAGSSTTGPTKPTDELGSRLSLTADRFADALYPRDVVVGVHVHNAGERSGRVALRSRQISFRVQGPDGVIECPRRTLSHVVPPDLFGRLGEGKQVEINVLLAEMCRRDVFRRPGLYVAMPKIDATEVDREKRVDAITGKVSTRDPGPAGSANEPDDDATLVRIRRGIESLHVQKPAVLATASVNSQSPGEIVDSAKAAVAPRPELVKPKKPGAPGSADPKAASTPAVDDDAK